MSALKSACILPDSFEACVLSILLEYKKGHTFPLNERLWSVQTCSQLENRRVLEITRVRA